MQYFSLYDVLARQHAGVINENKSAGIYAIIRKMIIVYM